MILDKVAYDMPPGSVGAPLGRNARWDGQTRMDGRMDGQKSQMGGQERGGQTEMGVPLPWNAAPQCMEHTQRWLGSNSIQGSLPVSIIKGTC
jgi:hypothetical protein